MKSSTQSCSICGGTVSGGTAFGLCGRCLVASAMEGENEHSDLLDGPGETEIEPGLPFERIGQYRLLRKLGEGAFGEVFAARQDEPVVRDVALKLLKRGMDSRQVVARFEAERQALALMNHPNIATVFDGGESPGGQPYFVLELVNGRPITIYCEEADLDLKARLNLFLDVCEGVRHAHQRGIIHRDLKPANVLVEKIDGVAVPKVIDFGIAKVTDRVLSVKTIITDAGNLIGTPAYMSPEQAASGGVDIDVRSDVYSLGMVLYQILAGRAPIEEEKLHGMGYAAIEKLITEEEPPRPSEHDTTLIRGKAGEDLDWIVMKALEKDRERRYQTVDDLARDLHSFLKGEAVEARPPSRAYRMRKFIRRHKGLIASAAAIFLVLVAGITVSTIQAIRATKAEAMAEERADVSNAAFDILNDDLLGDALEGGPMAAAGFIITLGVVEQKIQSKLSKQPLTEALARLALARAHLGMSTIFKGKSESIIFIKQAYETRHAALRNARLSYELYQKNLEGPDEHLYAAAAAYAQALVNLNRHKEAIHIIDKDHASLKKHFPDREDIARRMSAARSEAITSLEMSESGAEISETTMADLDPLDRTAWMDLRAHHQSLSRFYLKRRNLTAAAEHCRQATLVSAFINQSRVFPPFKRLSNVSLRNEVSSAGVPEEDLGSPLRIRIRDWDLEKMVASQKLPEMHGTMLLAWSHSYSARFDKAATIWKTILPEEPLPRQHRFFGACSLILKKGGHKKEALHFLKKAAALGEQTGDPVIVRRYKVMVAGLEKEVAAEQ